MLLHLLGGLLGDLDDLLDLVFDLGHIGAAGQGTQRCHSPGLQLDTRPVVGRNLAGTDDGRRRRGHGRHVLRRQTAIERWGRRPGGDFLRLVGLHKGDDGGRHLHLGRWCWGHGSQEPLQVWAARQRVGILVWGGGNGQLGK